MIGLNKIGLNQVQLNRLRLNAPFPAYGKMAGGGGSGDGFPQLPGDVTRWHFGGLTNEMMAAMDDPRIEDADGKGRFLSFKNLAWGGMSGVGGYADNWNSSADWDINSYWVNSHTDHKLQFIKVGTVVQMKSNNIYNAENVYKNILNVNGLTEAVNKGSVKALRINAVDPITSKTIKTFSFDTDGVIQISFDDVLQDYYVAYFLSGNNTNDIDITIEQLPLYPGFILGDGVDDFAVTEKELNFEDTYTVYTAFIPFQVDPTRAMEMCGKDFKKDFYLYYSNTHLVYYTSGLNNYIPVRINQFHIIVCKRNKTNAVIKNLITGESKTFSVSELIDNPGVYYLWRYQRSGTSTAKTAIAGQTICNGYFSTDEDDEKVLDWYKKQMPWLFPDQAWTVTGKTNEDEDRATIANITGNGNDLVLSNLGFAEGSGYGLYKLNFNNWFANSGSGNVNIVNVVNPHKIVLEQSQEAVGAFFLGKNVSYSGELKISVSNKPSDIELSFGSTALGKVILNEGINIVKINPVNTSIGFFTNKAFEAQNIIIEQIPEYEGYLITDGVDDSGRAVGVTISKDFTLVGEWILSLKLQLMLVYQSILRFTFLIDPKPFRSHLEQQVKLCQLNL